MSFIVRCDDAAVRRSAERWLDEARVQPPRTIEVSLQLTDTPWADRDARPFLAQPTLRFHHGAPGHAVRVVWRDGAGHALLAPGATAATIDLVRSVAAEPEQWLRPFLLPVLLVLLRRVGWHHLHAATARDPLGRGWLIAGDAQAGKSTTAALLAARGWAVGTDDTAFLLDGAARVEAASWRAPIALRAGGLALLAKDGAGLPLPRRGKAGFYPEDLGGSWLPRAAVDVVALAAVHQGPTRLESVTQAAAVAELLSWSLLFVVEPSDAQRHLDLVARLARQARCFRLLLGRDIIERPSLLEELPA